MDSHTIGYLQWFILAICFVFYYFYNKGFKPMSWLSNMAPKDTLTIAQQTSPHSPRTQSHKILTNKHLKLNYHKRKILILSLILTMELSHTTTNHQTNTLRHANFGPQNQTYNITKRKDNLLPITTNLKHIPIMTTYTPPSHPPIPKAHKLLRDTPT